MTILQKLDKVEEILKHQPGRHPQQRHAGGRGGDGKSTPSAPKEISSLQKSLGGDVTVGGKGTPYPKNGGVLKTTLSMDDAHAKIETAGYTQTKQGHFKKGNVRLRTMAVGPPRGKKKAFVNYTIREE